MGEGYSSYNGPGHRDLDKGQSLTIYKEPTTKPTKIRAGQVVGLKKRTKGKQSIEEMLEEQGKIDSQAQWERELEAGILSNIVYFTMSPIKVLKFLYSDFKDGKIDVSIPQRRKVEVYETPKQPIQEPQEQKPQNQYRENEIVLNPEDRLSANY